MALKALTFSALAIGLGAALTAAGAKQRTAQAEASHPPLGQFVTVAGGQVHYVQEGSGPHLILLHAAGGNLRDFTFDLMGTDGQVHCDRVRSPGAWIYRSRTRRR